MEANLTLDDLAHYTAESPEDLDVWREQGLLGGPDTEGFGFRDVARARLVRVLIDRGIGLDAISQVERDLRMVSRCVDEMHPTGDIPSIELQDAAEEAALDVGLARRIWDATGHIAGHNLLTADDVELLRGVVTALANGFPEAAVIQMVKVYADALGRVAEAEARLFHFYVHEPLRTAGLTGARLIDATERSSEPLRRLVEPTVLYFHRRATTEALHEDLVLHVAEETGHQAPPGVTGQLDVTVAFVDLAGYTALTEAMGDEPAVAVLDRFSDIVRQAVGRTGGRVVKQIGDAFMLVFADPAGAVACTLEINRAARVEPQFVPTRTGVHHGPVLYREGDYLGATVNVAARITSEAVAHQILTTADIATGASGSDVTFRPLGPRRLRGIANDIEIYELHTPTGNDDDSTRPTDPVCGMHLSPSDIDARLDLGGRERVFCSSRCLQLFVDAPGRYAAP